MAMALTALGAGSGMLATASTVASIAAPVLATAGAIANYKAGVATEKSYDQQAKSERVAANVKADTLRRQARQKQSAERTTMADAGALSGTAFGVLEQNAVSREMDALTVEYEGETTAKGLEAQGDAARSSPLSIFSTAISSASQVDPLNIGGVT